MKVERKGIINRVEKWRRTKRSIKPILCSIAKSNRTNKQKELYEQFIYYTEDLLHTLNPQEQSFGFVFPGYRKDQGSSKII